MSDTLEELWISYNNIEKLKGITSLGNLKVRCVIKVLNCSFNVHGMHCAIIPELHPKACDYHGPWYILCPGSKILGGCQKVGGQESAL